VWLADIVLFGSQPITFFRGRKIAPPRREEVARQIFSSPRRATSQMLAAS